jgi:hypothetical protein
MKDYSQGLVGVVRELTFLRFIEVEDRGRGHD